MRRFDDPRRRRGPDDPRRGRGRSVPAPGPRPVPPPADHQYDRSPPHELYARLDNRRGAAPRCDKKAGFHLINEEDVFAGNLPLLAEFVTEGGMIAKRHRSRLCAKCQRRVKRAVKRARQLGFVPTDAAFEAVNTLGFPDAEHKGRVSKTI